MVGQMFDKPLGAGVMMSIWSIYTGKCGFEYRNTDGKCFKVPLHKAIVDVYLFKLKAGVDKDATPSSFRIIFSDFGD